VLFERWIADFGPPVRLLSDRGKVFVSDRGKVFVSEVVQNLVRGWGLRIFSLVRMLHRQTAW
jgi:predicted house-cleaning NTP pyrophosphatase (Maf/HAM1 superfamily)